MTSYTQIIANKCSEQHEMMQKSIHILCDTLLKESKILKVPTLYQTENPNEYWFESFSAEKPLLLSRPDLFPSFELYSDTLQEFASLWKKCWSQGFILYDFSLYFQPNGTIFLRNFEYTAFKIVIQDKILAKLPTTTSDIELLFKNPCFPSEFVDLIGFVPGY